MARHKFHTPISVFIEFKRDCGGSTVEHYFEYVNRPDYRIVKSQNVTWVKTTPDGTTQFNAITVKPVDRMEYPKFILGLA
jgi:hypothetical protein